MISISNIAWDSRNDVAVSKLLKDENISFIDIAPSKYIDFNNFQLEDVRQIKKFWKDNGMAIAGIQSLFYGTNDLNIFGTIESQNKTLKHLENICLIANVLETKKLVFGSPRNRDRSHLDNKKSFDIAIEFFSKLGSIAAKHQVAFCLEPNPSIYNCNFMTNSSETAEIVKTLNNNYIKMQLDIGSLSVNKESVVKIIETYAPLIGHIHISEPYLLPINMQNPIHKEASSAIRYNLRRMPITIEMRTTNFNSYLDEIKSSISVLKDIYIK